MRSEKEMFALILEIAEKDERVRFVSMNGSRTNDNAPKDSFQDYDIVYGLTDMESFLAAPDWVDVFGDRIIMQTPEAMSLYPPTLGGRFTYLMLFTDGNRIDLMLLPLSDLEAYLQEDKLIKILLDKDQRIPILPPSSDKDYWVQKPNAAFYHDCCNEFWWLSTYVAKGLCRQELPYAIDHLAMMRQALFLMLSWELGVAFNFSKSMGKNYKYLPQFLPEETWQTLLKTYRNDTEENNWKALRLCCALFRKTSQALAAKLEFSYPDYDKKVTPYLNQLHANQTAE